MLFASYIEIFLNNMRKRQLQHFLIVFFIGFSLLPTIFNTPYYTVLYGGGKCLIYMIYVYILGRYIRLYDDKCISKRISLFIFLLSGLILCLLNMTVGYLFDKKCLIYAMDCSPFILISSIAIFFFFKSMNFYSKFINYLASSVLAVYLLGGIRFFIDKYWIGLDQYLIDDRLVFMLVLEVVLTFIIAIFIDKLRAFFLGSLEKRFINGILNIKYLCVRK